MDFDNFNFLSQPNFKLMENEKSASEEQQKSWTDNISETAGQLKEKAGKVFDQIEDKTEQLWKATEEKAGELADKIKSGELADDAKEKLNELAEGAKSLWDKVVDKFDGDDNKGKKPE